jgi:catechol 2,3-dioxygenase-like lactoylglutathione lyase family enzyme
MIDHITIRVSDMKKSEDFYARTLAPLGYKSIGEHDGAIAFAPDGDVNKGSIWITPEEGYVTNGMHVGFYVEREDVVQKFYKEALAVGGKSDGAPGLRTEYGGNYYAAFILDPDGNSIEAATYDKSLST